MTDSPSPQPPAPAPRRAWQQLRASDLRASARLATQATVIDNIINNRIVTVSERAPATDLLILFILGGVCAFVLPRVTTLYRMIILAAGLIILANVYYFMASSFNTLPQLMNFTPAGNSA